MKNFYYFLHFICCFLLFAENAHAQVGSCEASLGEAYLDAGNVRARILNNGALFWRGSPHVYEAPVGIGVSSIFAAGIWVGGMVNNELRVAASRYGPWEFWSGPLDDNGNPPDDCSVFDKIWEVRRVDIEDFLNLGAISDNLKHWPWQLGAPVVDGDGIPDNYNLEGGDLPELLGDQRLWWIMNDRGNEHEATDSKPIGLEVHASAFSFSNSGPVGNFTFYDYLLINKNNVPVTNTYFTLFTDVDLGDFSDDYIGSDSLLHLGYAYNSDEIDNACGIDFEPPAVGFTFLETILADTDGFDNDRDGEIDESGEMMGTSSVFRYGGGGGVVGDPVTKSDYYNYMQATWKDGKPLLKGGFGYDRFGLPADLPLEPTKFVLSGDPVTKSFWSEFNINGEGLANHPSDRALITSTGPFEIAPWDTVNVRIAIVWSQGEDHLDSVTRLKSETAGVRSVGSAFYSPTKISPKNVATPSYLLGFGQNYPNPFSRSTTIRYSVPHTMQVKLAVYDVLGREVAILVNTQQQEGIYNAEFNAADLQPGLYFAHIELDHLRFTKQMVLIR